MFRTIKPNYVIIIILMITMIINSTSTESGNISIDTSNTSQSILPTTITVSNLDYTKEYNTINNTIIIKTKDNVTLLNSRLETPHINHVSVGVDIQVAQINLIDYINSTVRIFDKIDLYNLNDKISRKIVYKYLNKDNQWIVFNNLSELPYKNIKIGLFTDVFKNDYVEWVPSIYGFNVSEWAIWQSYANITGGLTAASGYSHPCVFEKDGTFYLIAGSSAGFFYSYNWSESLGIWMPYYAMNNTLYDVGSNSAPTIFQKNNTLYLIAGNDTGTYTGWNWSGEVWQSYVNITSGIGDTGAYVTPTIFKKNDTFYFISSGASGTFIGKNYSESLEKWVAYSNISGGLPDLGAYVGADVFEKNGTFYLIAGNSSGNYTGFNWSETTSSWLRYDNLSTTKVDDYIKPTVFDKDGTWYMISGGYTGRFFGYNLTEDILEEYKSCNCTFPNDFTIYKTIDMNCNCSIQNISYCGILNFTNSGYMWINGTLNATFNLSNLGGSRTIYINSTGTIYAKI